MEFKILDLTNKTWEENTTNKKRPAVLVTVNDNPYNCGIYDNLDLANNAILKEMLDYNKLYPTVDSVWVQNGAQTVFVRVPYETLKKYSFHRICNDSNLYQFKFKIHGNIVNAPIFSIPPSCLS